MTNQVLPLPRECGYWLFKGGEQHFVMRHPIEHAKVYQFPRRDRAIERAVGAMIEAAIDTPLPREKLRFVSRRADQLDAILDEIDGYRGEE